MATVFTIMGYGGMTLAVICLVIAVILFIKWNIPKVFGDITGRNERKSIEKIRKERYEANTSKKVSFKTAKDTKEIQVRKTEADSLADQMMSNVIIVDEEATVVLNSLPEEETTTVLEETKIAEVIQLPNETYTQMGTVEKVLDFIITHTDEVIS